jgi:hypothetical protein
MKTSKTLSPKQKKIAQVAGDPNKIEGEDFKKLKTMKASEGVEIKKTKMNKMVVGGAAVKGMGAVANRGMGLQDEMLQPGETTVVGKGSDYIKDLIS